MPVVSILMTVYNREKYIEEAIQSVLNCGFEDWELIIVDDGSKDRSVSIIQQYARQESRVQFYQNVKNLGDYPNRNKAASYATGKYMVIVDSDDHMFPGQLANWIADMERSAARFGIFTDRLNGKNHLLSSQQCIAKHFFDQPVLSFGPIATIVEVNYFRKIGGFPELYGPANDMYYNLKAASHTPTLLLFYPLVNYRQHGGQEIHNKYSYLYNNYRFLRDALAQLPLPLTRQQKKVIAQKNKRRFVSNWIGYLFKTGNFKKALRVLKLSGFRLRDLPGAIFNNNYEKQSRAALHNG